MRKIIFVYAIAVSIVACNNAASDKAATATQQQAAKQTGKQYEADKSVSIVNWRATHKGGMAPRFGTLAISDGNLSVNNGAVTAGNFIVDVNSLVVDTASVTEKEKKASDLQNHLKSPDFFNAGKYPTAKFVITHVEPYDSTKGKSELEGATNMVSGNLTLKDSTVNITFPAKISVSDNRVDVTAKFVVDRTTWGLNYKAEGNPADWMISKDFELALNIKASAK